MNAPTTLQSLQPSLILSSQSGIIKHSVRGDIDNYTLLSRCASCTAFCCRPLHPLPPLCLTLSELKKFMDELNDTIQRCTAEGQRTDFMDCVSSIWVSSRLVNHCPEHCKVFASLQAQVLRVSALVCNFQFLPFATAHRNGSVSTCLILKDVIAHERRVRDEVKDQYHHMLNSEERRRRRRGPNANADTGSFGWTTSLLQRFRIPGQGDQ
ncbi:hypothetical protein K435DRAFT_875833 [Dendrothele bispora CBS 962.96]|uniref:Uncharacterized protein n=1 Tax=Dendrothele bispora (strain CBS 962.96) TaxID=1314807 RepID=A0A4S8KTL1_DENBC|nr:hypothetical protein K435DRAFT_875833 [Dendrothele bispora CBS 962.96]